MAKRKNDKGRTPPIEVLATLEPVTEQTSAVTPDVTLFVCGRCQLLAGSVYEHPSQPGVTLCKWCFKVVERQAQEPAFQAPSNPERG